MPQKVLAQSEIGRDEVVDFGEAPIFDARNVLDNPIHDAQRGNQFQSRLCWIQRVPRVGHRDPKRAMEGRKHFRMGAEQWIEHADGERRTVRLSGERGARGVGVQDFGARVHRINRNASSTTRSAGTRVMQR